MELKKILILEDFIEDFRRIAAVLDKFNCVYFPHDFDDAIVFTDLLADWAEHPTESKRTEIRQVIENFKPDYFLLDVGLKASSDTDDFTGIQLQDELLKPVFEEVDIYQITGRYRKSNLTARIAKNSELGLENELISKFLNEVGIQRSVSKKSGETTEVSSLNRLEEKIETKPSNFTSFDKIKAIRNTSANTGKNAEFEEPRFLIILKRLNTYKLKTIIQWALDNGILYIFYILMAILAWLGFSSIFKEFRDSKPILSITETTFVAFLPLLVIFGFFVFYIESLQPYIQGAKVDEIDPEKTSRLVMFTKKLFISSIISYLFINLVDLLYVDVYNSSTPPANPFSHYYHQFGPYDQIYFICGSIIILIFYYIYLNNHKHPSKQSSISEPKD